jgi:putative MFS transporter
VPDALLENATLQAIDNARVGGFHRRLLVYANTGLFCDGYIVLGLAIGADYPIAAALIAECMPARGRGAALNSMQVVWFAGACAAYAVGYALVGVPESWRWILASSAVPALVGLALRSSAPESARWLAARGRHAEAKAIVQRHFGAAPARLPESAPTAVSLSAIFRRPYAGALAFVSAMWLLQVVPLFAIYTFAPTVLTALHLGGASPIGSLAITVAFLAGSLLAMPALERAGRRPLCIAGFLVSTLAFVAIGLGPASIVIGAFVCYAIAIGAAAGLELIYPSELFPTPIRASATGLAAGISRIGAFAGTFALPVALARLGVAPVIWTSAALSLVGLAIALAFAQETRGRVLDTSS